MLSLKQKRFLSPPEKSKYSSLSYSLIEGTEKWYYSQIYTNSRYSISFKTLLNSILYVYTLFYTIHYFGYYIFYNYIVYSLQNERCKSTAFFMDDLKDLPREILAMHDFVFVH